ncbi:MAG: hypothetical protein LBO09_03245 [Candidatus Peribacteria bacterium]|nr:hypothetical protein [Candidatus Peribacteria bacterium]
MNAASGVVIGTNTPNTLAALTISGDLRIQPNSKDTLICDANTKGTMKSVATGGQLCSCFCDGQSRQATLETPTCIRACDINKKGLNSLETICDNEVWSG